MLHPLNAYGLPMCRMFLELPVFGYTGHMLKSLGRLGDRVAASFLMSVPEERLYDPEISKRIAFAMRSTFAAAPFSECSSDREPRFSIFLLERLIANSTDPDARENLQTSVTALRELSHRLDSASAGDAYQVAVIHSYLKRSFFLLTGTLLKTFSRLGDRVAVSIMMCLDDKAINDPETARRIAVALDITFKEPTGFVCEIDAQPVFSIFYLERTLRLCSHQESRRLIEEQLTKLKERVARCEQGLS